VGVLVGTGVGKGVYVLVGVGTAIFCGTGIGELVGTVVGTGVSVGVEVGWTATNCTGVGDSNRESPVGFPNTSSELSSDMTCSGCHGKVWKSLVIALSRKKIPTITPVVATATCSLEGFSMTSTGDF
tara:strand:- start:1040 stop:1420 length:381 start_codon:yes stop_codon:yes gene_type:complete